MTKLAQKKNQGGRPKSYAPELVHKIVLEFIGNGVSSSNITSSMVKEHLCEHYGISWHIRPEPLEELVRCTLGEHAEEERLSLLASLPDGVTAVVDSAMQAAGRELTLLIAQENAACKSVSDAECDVLRADKRNANWRIAELEARLKERDLELAALKQEHKAASARASEIALERDAALEEVARIRQEADTVDRLLEKFSDPAIRCRFRAAITEIVGTQADPACTN